MKDDEDDDWSFVPEKILTHQLRRTPRWIHKTNEEEKTMSVSNTKRHLRTNILWKDETVLWCGADASRLKNPFVYIPYVCKQPKLLKHQDFK